MRRRLDDQTPDAAKLLAQLREGEVLRIGYAYGDNPNSGLYLHPEQLDRAELEARMRPAGDNPVTFYAVPENEV